MFSHIATDLDLSGISKGFASINDSQGSIVAEHQDSQAIFGEDVPLSAVQCKGE